MVEYFLLGDSHIAAIQQGCRDMGVSVGGEGHMTGPLWHDGQFSFRNGNFVLATADLTRVYTHTLKALNAKSLADVNVPIVLSVGYHTRGFNQVFTGYRVSQEDDRKQFLSVAATRALVLPMRRAHIDAVAALCAMGKKVFVVTPPQRDADFVLAFLINDIISAEMRAVGATVIDTRDFALGADNKLLPEYCSPKAGDNAHGNSRYGQEIMKRVMAH